MSVFSSTLQLVDGVHWVGVKDADRRLFDALIKLPRGTSYNSFFIQGSKNTAIIDTVYRDFSDEFVTKVNSLVPIADVDYLIMNHAEPDHASAIPYFLSVNNKAKIYMTKLGVAMATKFYQVPDGRIVVINDGDEIDLGGKTLRFIEAPMLHWPETMFTYLVEDKILFPCDFFGAHIADGFYTDEVDDIMEQAKKYFAEIMMPFRPFAKKAMDKLSELEIKMIATSHGPIYREVVTVMNEYNKWIAGERINKAVITYVSMWGDTAGMAKNLADELTTQGVEVVSYDLAVCDLADVAKDLVDAKVWVIGASSMLNQVHPLAGYAINVIELLKTQVPYTAILGSYGWAKTVEKNLTDLLEPLKAEIIGAIEVKGPADNDERDEIKQLADNIAIKIKE